MGVRDTGRLDTEIIKKGESWSERKRVKKQVYFRTDIIDCQKEDEHTNKDAQ